MRVTPETTLENTKERWDGYHASGQYTIQYPFDEVLHFVHAYFPKDRNPANVRVLEVGCGSGNNLGFILDLGCEVYGIDASSAAISAASRRFTQRTIKPKLSIGCFTSLPYADNFFDLVIDRHSIACVDKLSAEKSLREIQRVCRPGAVFLFSPLADSDTRQKLGQLQADGLVYASAEVSKNMAFRGYSFYSQDEVLKLVNEHWNVLDLVFSDRQNLLNQSHESSYFAYLQRK